MRCPIASMHAVVAFVCASITPATIAWTATTGSNVGTSSTPVTNGRPPAIAFPVREGSVRFAVIGDTGTGNHAQQQLADMMVRYRSAFPFEFVLMLGDNLYGGEEARDYVRKFERPYKNLLASGVKFYATLGNHDESAQRFYRHFNMEGREYYTFRRGNVRLFSLNSDYMDAGQLNWVEEQLRKSNSDWKICFFHHPLYSSGKKHGPDDDLRRVLEPLFVRHGVNLVLSGHEHFYERLEPQKGIYYFISGAGGKLRRGGVYRTKLTADSYDGDLHFMLVQIDGDIMHFQVITRTGETVDQGLLPRPRR